MGTFLRKKGSHDRASSPVFYTGCVFFEKIRVKEGRKKGKKREGMEGVWEGKGGFSAWSGSRERVDYYAQGRHGEV
jgi:hypothetical protein